MILPAVSWGIKCKGEGTQVPPTYRVGKCCVFFISSRISKYIFLTLSPLPADRAELRKITTFKENTIYNEHTVSSHEDKQP